MEIFKTNMDLLRNMEDEMQKVNAVATAGAENGGA